MFRILAVLAVLVSARTVNAQTSYSWAAAADGTWATAGAWTPNGTPGSADTATIAATGANYTVSVGGATSVSRLVLNSDNATLGGAGPLTVGTGRLSWSRGQIATSLVLNNGGLIETAATRATLAGSSVSLANTQVLQMFGGVWEHSGALNLGTSSRFELNAGSTFTVNAGGTVTGAGEIIPTTGTTVFLNTTAPVTIPFLTVEGGTISGVANASLAATGITTGGGAIIQSRITGLTVSTSFLTIGNPLWLTDSQMTVTGSFNWNAQDRNVEGLGTSRITVAPGATWQISAQSGGVLRPVSLLGRDGGTLRVDQNGTATLGRANVMGGSAGLTLGIGVTLNNAGSFAANGSTLTITAPATLNNSGTLTLVSGLPSHVGPTVLTVDGVLSNNGTMSTTGTASLKTQVAVSGTWSNAGSFTANGNTTVATTGTGTWTNAGSFTANGNTTLTNAGTIVSSSGTFTVADTATITNFSGGTLTGGTWRTLNGGFDWGTRAIATVAANTVVELQSASASFPALVALTQQNGTLRLASGASFGTTANTLNVGGTFEVGPGSTFTKGVAVRAGGILRGTGTVGGALAVEAGGRLSPGVGTLTVGGPASVAGGGPAWSPTVWEVSLVGVAPNTPATASTQASRVALTGASTFNLVASGTEKIRLRLELTGGSLTNDQSVNYVIASAPSGSSFQVNGGAFAFDPSHYEIATSGFVAVSTYEVLVVNNDLVLRFVPTPVPEPASVLAVVGLGGWAFAALRRARRSRSPLRA